MTYIQESVGRAARPDIDELRGAVRGEVFAEGDDGYAEAARIWNGAHDGRVDVHLIHGGEIDHRHAVAGREARDAVAPTPHGDLQIVPAGEAERGDHVVRAGAPHDQGRPGCA